MGLLGIALEVGLKRSTETGRAGKLWALLYPRVVLTISVRGKHCVPEDEDDDEYEGD